MVYGWNVTVETGWHHIHNLQPCVGYLPKYHSTYDVCQLEVGPLSLTRQDLYPPPYYQAHWPLLLASLLVSSFKQHLYLYLHPSSMLVLEGG